IRPGGKCTLRRMPRTSKGKGFAISLTVPCSSWKCQIDPSSAPGRAKAAAVSSRSAGNSMNRTPFIRGMAAGGLGVALALGATVAWAQRPLSGKFDLTKPVELSGIVTFVDWRNPQAHVFLNVKRAGATLNWAVELES